MKTEYLRSVKYLCVVATAAILTSTSPAVANSFANNLTNNLFYPLEEGGVFLKGGAVTCKKITRLKANGDKEYVCEVWSGSPPTDSGFTEQCPISAGATAQEQCMKDAKAKCDKRCTAAGGDPGMATEATEKSK